jgi:hypothetical protein
MRKAMILGFILYLIISFFAFTVLAEDFNGDEAAGTYRGTLSLVMWDPEDYETYTGKTSSTPVVAFPSEVTLTFYKRGFTSETEFILRAELNGTYYQDNDGLNLSTDPSSKVRWHPETYESYQQPAGPEPSFQFGLTDEPWLDGYVNVRAWTIYDDSLEDFKVFFRAEMMYLNDYDRTSIVSIQQGYLQRTQAAVYYAGDGPYDPQNPIDDDDEPCNPIDFSGAIQVNAGVTFTKGNNTYRKNADCSTGRIRRNQPFINGDVLMTGSGEDDIMEVSLGGGGEFSSVGGEPFFRMRRLSVWTVVPDDHAVKFRISKGQIMFRDMTSKFKQLYSKEEIIIETGGAAMSIRGTELYIYVEVNGDTTVYVTHGEVLVEDLYGGELTLLAGQKVDISVDGGLGYSSFITDSEYDDFESFEVEESNFIWTVIVILLILSPIILLVIFFKFIKRIFKPKKAIA